MLYEVITWILCGGFRRHAFTSLRPHRSDDGGHGRDDHSVFTRTSNGVYRGHDGWRAANAIRLCRHWTLHQTGALPGGVGFHERNRVHHYRTAVGRAAVITSYSIHYTKLYDDDLAFRCDTSCRWIKHGRRWPRFRHPVTPGVV